MSRQNGCPFDQEQQCGMRLGGSVCYHCFSLEESLAQIANHPDLLKEHFLPHFLNTDRGIEIVTSFIGEKIALRNETASEFLDALLENHGVRAMIVERAKRLEGM